MQWKIWRCEACDKDVTDGNLKHSMSPGVFFPIVEKDGLRCGHCGCYLHWHWFTTGRAFGINNAPYCKPLHSDALGIQPDQVAEHREMFPGVEIDSENRPVFTNANQHDAYMEKAGIQKDVQKTRRPGEVIARLGDEDADGTDEAKVPEKDTEETKDAGRVHEDGLDKLVVADV